MGKPASNSTRCRVLLVAASLGGGGAERVMLTLAKHLNHERFETHLAVANAKGPLFSEVPPDVVLHDLKASRVRYCLPALLRLIWRLRPAAILSTSMHVNFSILATRGLLPPGTKIFVRENSTASAEAVATGDMKRRRFLYRWLYRYADAVICQSGVMLDDLCAQFSVPPDRVVRIYNPVDRDRIRTLAADGPNPLTGAGPHLVAAGRLENSKGFDLLLDAMAEVKKSIPQARLTIIGTGSREQELRNQCSRLGLSSTVAFAGFRNNPYPYYANADLFVLSSRYEGLPNAMLEAMALNTPVVATDCPGGVREIVDGWPNCTLAKPEDPSSLAVAIRQSLQTKRQYVEPAADCLFNQTSLFSVLGAYENLFRG